MVGVVIVAAGKGSRMGLAINKAYARIPGSEREILALTIEKFNNHPDVSQIVVVTGQHEIDFCLTNIIGKYGFDKVSAVVPGGRERQDSVVNGLNALGVSIEYVLIHDGARPFVSAEVISHTIDHVRRWGACTVAVPVKDTIKTLDDDGMFNSTLKRQELFLIQTPQAFRKKEILEAHLYAREHLLTATDDTKLVEELGIKVKMVMGDYCNIKITTAEDLIFGEAILRIQSKGGEF